MTPSDPVPSALLNELQDRDIVTSGPRDIFIGGDAFFDLSGAGSATLNNTGSWTIVNYRTIATGLVLPAGTVVNDIRLSSNQGTGTFIFASITRRSFGDGGAAANGGNTGIIMATSEILTHGSWTISPASGSILPGPITIQSGYYYTLYIDQAGTGTSLSDGVKLTIEGP